MKPISNSTDRRRVLFVAATLAMTWASTAYGAEGYPSHPIRIVVGYSAGGPNDTIARALGQKLTEILGQQTIVDNRPGADGVIGTDLVAKSVADGHTLALVSSSHTINPSLQPKLPYDPVRDFAPVTMAASGPTVLVVHPSLPARSVTELMALARIRPGQLMYASSGTGGTLQAADSVTGPWADVAGATSPRTVTPSGTAKFYRIKN